MAWPWREPRVRGASFLGDLRTRGLRRVIGVVTSDELSSAGSASGAAGEFVEPFSE